MKEKGEKEKRCKDWLGYHPEFSFLSLPFHPGHLLRFFRSITLLTWNGTRREKREREREKRTERDGRDEASLHLSNSTLSIFNSTVFDLQFSFSFFTAAAAKDSERHSQRPEEHQRLGHPATTRLCLHSAFLGSYTYKIPRQRRMSKSNCSTFPPCRNERCAMGIKTAIADKTKATAAKPFVMASVAGVARLDTRRLDAFNPTGSAMATTIVATIPMRFIAVI